MQCRWTIRRTRAGLVLSLDGEPVGLSRNVLEIFEFVAQLNQMGVLA